MDVILPISELWFSNSPKILKSKVHTVQKEVQHFLKMREKGNLLNISVTAALCEHLDPTHYFVWQIRGMSQK